MQFVTASVNPIAATNTGLHCLYCPLSVVERTGDHRDLCCLYCPFVFVERTGDHRDLHCLYCPFVVERTDDHRDLCCLCCSLTVVERTGDHRDLCCLYCSLIVVERTDDHRDMCGLFCPFVVVKRTSDDKDLPAYQGTLNPFAEGCHRACAVHTITSHVQCTQGTKIDNSRCLVTHFPRCLPPTWPYDYQLGEND